MIIPNFLIIGAGKSGTSSLYYYLKQHPQIYMSSLKEPKFFAFEGDELDFKGPATESVKRFSVTTLEEYRKLFEDVTNELAVGEASPIYMYSPKAALKIKQYIPKVKIIAILRQPAERAFSAFSHLVREGYETLSFEEALQQEQKRIDNKWNPLFYYQDSGFYYSQLKMYFELFEREQIKVYLYEDLRTDTSALLQNIFDFLNVERNFQPDLTKKNVSGIPKSRFVYDLFTKDNIVKTAFKPLFSNRVRRTIYDTITTKTLNPKPEMLLDTKLDLTRIYKQDILQLQELIDRDLSNWLF